MLVLSRKSEEEIHFPALGVSIRVLRTSANCVKLGISAPRNLRVVRGELNEIDQLIHSISAIQDPRLSHDLRNQLNTLVLNLELLKRAQTSGMTLNDLDFVQNLAQSLDHLDAEFRRLAEPVRHPVEKLDKTRLMVVDDNANERELLSAVLSIQGFEVQSAADGEDALNRLLAMAELPHAVLLDMQMPRRNGAATLQCIRENQRLVHLKVIGISGETNWQPRRGENAGFDAWFSKPLQLERLVSLIHQSEYGAN